MGTIKQGILGGFSGKVGTVIGGSWKGISYMRSQAQSVKNPRTDGQLSQRSKFALALDFLKPLTDIVRTGFKLYTNKQTAFNAAMSYTLANAISGDYPDYELNFASALISRGSLTSATNGVATSANGSVTVTWGDNTGVGTAKATDKALIAVLNADKGEAVTVSAGEARSTVTQTVSVPADWVGEEVQVYLGFISADAKEVANSVYLGAVTVA
ncbi:MAG: DUF6266 family protein [Bacteroidales bacterium]|nr:DUF6266 family protein [Bacteroidales bacterium]